LISTDDRNEIIDLLIDKLSSSDSEFPYSEIEEKYNVRESIVVAEILKELSSQGIIKESGNTFHSGRLLARGLEIKRSGGWLKLLELSKKEEDKQRLREEVELENIRYSTKLSKIQIRWFNISLIIGFIGGVSGLLALFLELNGKMKTNDQEPKSIEKTKTTLATDSLHTSDIVYDSLKNDSTQHR